MLFQGRGLRYDYREKEILAEEGECGKMEVHEKQNVGEREQDLRVKRISEMEKVFPGREPSGEGAAGRLSGLKGETVSFQIAYYGDTERKQYGTVRAEAPDGVRIRVRKVGLAPCAYPCHRETDPGYLVTEPGMYPDILEDIAESGFPIVPGQWRSLWADIETAEDTPAGEYPVTVILESQASAPGMKPLQARVEAVVEVVDARLPELELFHTEWLHCDCLAQYYGVEVFSRRHWEIIENFVGHAVKRGCNMLLTPVFTPPLDTAVDGYRDFLQAFLSSFTEEIERLGIGEQCFFHVSDEPGRDDLESYAYAKKLVKQYLPGYRVIDALSDYRFYEQGLADEPVCANDHIEPFLEKRPPRLWTYYCTGQHLEVSNRFISLPGFRTRILGVQLYKYAIEGFLHWGYNFYNSDFSRYPIDPYRCTDADGAFPSGDPFLVYPGKDGNPVDSIRSMLMEKAMADLRAMCCLEKLTGRERVLECLMEKENGEITFRSFPQSIEYLALVRERINEAIRENCRK